MGKTIGVLGGMGPAATALFYQHLIRLTPARRDQDHLPVIIFSRPQIPDRTRHLLEGGDSPLPLLIDTARRLESAGAELISIPCNTAHVFWKEIQACVRIPVLNIICETAKEIRRSLDLGSRVAIFSTAGTLRTGLYQSALSEVGLEPMEPDTKTQEEIRELIRRIKGGEEGAAVSGRITDCMNRCRQVGARGILLGCTELGVGFRNPDDDPFVFDSLIILAQKTLAAAMAPEIDNAAPFSGTVTAGE